MVNNKIGLHIIGGLGDVSLTRKYPVIYQTDLTRNFEISSIADVYPRDRVKDESAVTELLREIQENRLKGQFNPEIQNIFKNALLHSIQYYKLDKDDPKLPQKFFDSITPGDVIDISVPNTLHLPLAIQVLDHNGNLLVEKPLCSSLEDAIKFEKHIFRLNLNERVLTDAEHYSHYGNIKFFYQNFERFSHDRLYGFGLGKITSLELSIEEDEDFSSQRNQEIVKIKKSGGGIWLDTGIHAISFLRSIGAEIDHCTVEAQPYKSSDPRIQGDEYGETSMRTSFDIIPNDYFFSSCRVDISVGKCFQARKKQFILNYERGKIELDMSKKSLQVFDENNFSVANFSSDKDAFYFVFDDLRKCILYRELPFTSITKAIENLKEVFLIYKKANPVINL